MFLSQGSTNNWNEHLFENLICISPHKIYLFSCLHPWPCQPRCQQQCHAQTWSPCIPMEMNHLFVVCWTALGLSSNECDDFHYRLKTSTWKLKWLPCTLFQTCRWIYYRKYPCWSHIFQALDQRWYYTNLGASAKQASSQNHKLPVLDRNKI